GGRQSNATTGIYFTYAQQPWGPWATPQLIFNKKRDQGGGVFIHDPNIVPDDGLDGPVIGTNDPYTTPGGAEGPFMIERFMKVLGSTLKIYYVVGTYNPYTVVKMRSEFTISRAAPTLTSLSQTLATAGSAALTLTVNGTNFVNGSVLQWNGGNRMTTFVSD